MSGRADSLPTSSGVHARMFTPFGTYRKASRRGAAAADPAGTGAANDSDSSQGRATAVPSPLSIVRRLIGFVMGNRPSKVGGPKYQDIRGGLLAPLALPLLERVGPDDREHHRGELVLPGRRALHDLVHRTLIVIL